MRVGRGLSVLFLDRIWAVILVAGVIVAVVLGVQSRSQPHHVRVAFDEAVNLGSGMSVQAAGVEVGKVDSVSYVDGQAIVRIGIKDSKAWPLRQGTVAELRWGSTAGNGNRRIELTPGPDSGKALGENAVIGRADSVTPVELDQVQQTFDSKTRASLQSLLGNANAAMQGHTAQANAGFKQLAPALRGTGGVMRDLADSQQSLAALLDTGDRVTGTLARHRTQIGGLVEVMSATADTLYRNSRAMQNTISALAPTFAQVRTTFARLNPSLDRLQSVLVDLKPGIDQLPRLAKVTNPALAALRPTAAQGRALVSNAVRTAPGITQFFTRGAPLAKSLASVSGQAQPITKCLAPYAPEVAGFASNWASFTQEYDDIAHYARAEINESYSSVTDTPELSTSAFTSLTNLRYNGLPAPGAIGGDPLYDASCGVGKDAGDAHNDWDDPK